MVSKLRRSFFDTSTPMPPLKCCSLRTNQSGGSPLAMLRATPSNLEFGVRCSDTLVFIALLQSKQHQHRQRLFPVIGWPTGPERPSSPVHIRAEYKFRV